MAERQQQYKAPSHMLHIDSLFPYFFVVYPL